jgi:SAM-dependent methyltransferase
MESYASWAPFYDAMHGDRAAQAAYVRTLIERHHPAAETLLELGCGTGSVLKHLEGRYDLTGVDLSRDMLRVAEKKVPGARLVHHDMTTVDLGEAFDAVVCIGDAVNHLRPFKKWESLFTRARDHLAAGGVFVFDMNTQLHLSELAADPPLTSWSAEGDFALLDVVEAAGDGVTVEATIFERRRNGDYRLHSASVPEISFPVERVTKTLRRRFGRVRVYDQNRARPTPRSERLHFVCTR